MQILSIDRTGDVVLRILLTDSLFLSGRKRTCYFNAGMSHSCDYKEVLKSVDDANYWSNEYTPGRRRKRQISPALVRSLATTNAIAENKAAVRPMNVGSF